MEFSICIQQNYKKQTKAFSILFIKPINLYSFILLSIALFYFLVWLPLDNQIQETKGFAIPYINDSDQSMCYKSYVWNDENKHLRYKYILDDDLLEKSNGSNIFFHLTNCIHDGIVDLTPRQACAVESAARVNTHMNIFLTYTSAVGLLNRTRLPLIDALSQYKNINIRNIDLETYPENTPAELWIKRGHLFNSKHMKAHVSDFMRLVSLYRFGGQYLDVDTVSMKNISNLGVNFAGAEDSVYVANAVMNFDINTEIGRKVVELCLQRFVEAYNPERWSANGPMLVSKVLRDVCKKKNTNEMTRENCQGFHIYDASHFYAISYKIYTRALTNDPERVKEMFKIIENSTLVHMSNNFSKGKIIQVDLPHAYGILAEMYCPKVYHSLVYYF